MKCSIFIATSEDGYIASKTGDISWLETSGKLDADMGEYADMGFNDYIASVDCMIMGRNCMEKIASFNLTPEQWPYGDMPIFVLSHTLKQAPENLQGKVEIYSGEIPALIAKLEKQGFQHAYIDGGATITSFLNLQLIQEMTLTRAPILLGEGIPLFGKLSSSIKLENAQSKAFPNDFIQTKYQVSYSS